MSERFNFYDVYGYLIPGISLVLMLWVPFGITSHSLPDEKVTAAVGAVVIGYIIGQLIQRLAGELLSTKTARSGGQAQYPSVTLLDPSDHTLPQIAKETIQKNVTDWFGIDVHVTEDAGTNQQILNARHTAFFNCRPVVNKTIGYAEQFQGLYAMFGGLTISFTLAAAYLLGWALAALLAADIRLDMGIVLGIALSFALLASLVRFARVPAKREQNVAWDVVATVAFTFFVFAAGYLIGAQNGVRHDDGLTILVSAVLSVIAALRCYDGYRAFTIEFAKAVWQYLPAKPPPAPGIATPQPVSGGAIV